MPDGHNPLSFAHLHLTANPSVIPTIIPSHGDFSGTCVGAFHLADSAVLAGVLAMQLETISANWAVALANFQTENNQSMEAAKAALEKKYHIPDIRDKIQQGKDLSTLETAQLQEFTQELGRMQTIVQAAAKAIDPTLTTVQNLPQQLASSQTEFIHELEAPLQALAALPNYKIQTS